MCPLRFSHVTYSGVLAICTLYPYLQLFEDLISLPNLSQCDIVWQISRAYSLRKTFYMLECDRIWPNFTLIDIVPGDLIGSLWSKFGCDDLLVEIYLFHTQWRISRTYVYKVIHGPVHALKSIHLSIFLRGESLYYEYASELLSRAEVISFLLWGGVRRPLNCWIKKSTYSLLIS